MAELLPHADAPTAGIWRVGRQSDPLHCAPPKPITDNHKAGNRFDSLNLSFTTVYGGTSLQGCYAEVLARFRPAPGLAELVRDEWDQNRWTRVGNVPADWRHQRIAVRLSSHPDGPFLNVEHPDTLASLHILLGTQLNYYGVEELDVSVLRGPDRRVTRHIAQWAHDESDENGVPFYAGIRYLSRVDSGQELWAVFDRTELQIEEQKVIRLQDQELRTVAERYRLTLH